MLLSGAAHRTPTLGDAHNARLSRPARVGVLIVAAALTALFAQLVPGGTPISPVRAASEAQLKAVFIVGPTNGLTASNLTNSEKMAQQAEAVGMDVRRVFFPHATWDNVLANIQGANLVVYMGHGYGWPSPYTKDLTESRQNGMGLNSFDGSASNQYTYYGASRLRESVKLADNAVVLLNHLCYAAGNGESGMAIPTEDLARQRVDNMANGWLATGARAVFAYTWNQKVNLPAALANSNSTMDELFMTPAKGGPNGFIGWQDVRFDSERTPGAMNHLDPHPKYGYYRALTGDLNMNAAEFRAGAAAHDGPPPPPVDEAGAPQITSLSADGDSSAGTAAAADSDPAAFHPNGDGIDDELLLSHTVTKATNLDVTVTSQDGAVVRTFSVWSVKGSSTSRWDGRANGGAAVTDGLYRLTYVPRDSSGVTGNPVSVDALVLTAIKLAKPSATAFFARDADALARKTKLVVTVNQSAQINWVVTDATGQTVRTIRTNSNVGAGTLASIWDGKTDNGDWAADGWYSSRVTAQTSLGSYVQERQVFVGAYRFTPSTDAPARGSTLNLTIRSTEPLSGSPSVTINQPGVQPWTVNATRINNKKFKLTITLATAGAAGTVELSVAGADTRGGTNQGSLSLTLR